MLCSTRRADFASAEAVLQRLIRAIDTGALGSVDLVWFYNALIASGRRIIPLERIDAVYREMLNSNARLELDSFMLTNLVRHALRSEGPDVAWRYLLEVVEAGVPVDRNVCSVLVPQFIWAKNERRCLELLEMCRESAKTTAFCPFQRTYHIAVLLMLGQRSWKNAQLLLDMAQHDGHQFGETLVKAVQQRCLPPQEKQKTRIKADSS
jgi:hypothetical protein